MLSAGKHHIRNIGILYESKNYIVVNKPPDFLINSDDENNLNTLQHALSSKISIENVNIKHGFHFIHRLDYATSGVICLGRNKYASATAGKLFETRLVHKYYIAIVRGLVLDELTIVDTPIGYDKNYLHTSKKMCSDGDNCINPKKAITKILVLETGQFDGHPATKIMLKPLTGRRHQLRLHCHLLGHNIVGDYTYSNGEDVKPSRMFLHSFRLILPMVDEPIDICSADPFTHSKYKEWISEYALNTINNNKDDDIYNKLDNYQCNQFDEITESDAIS